MTRLPGTAQEPTCSSLQPMLGQTQSTATCMSRSHGSHRTLAQVGQGQQGWGGSRLQVGSQGPQYVPGGGSRGLWVVHQQGHGSVCCDRPWTFANGC